MATWLISSKDIKLSSADARLSGYDSFTELEKELDYIVNYFLPYETGPLVEATWDVAATAEAVSEYILTHASTWDIEHSGLVDPIVELTHAASWTIEHAASVDTVVTLSHAADWQITGSASADVLVSITHAAEWQIDGSADATSEFRLVGSADFDIASVAEVDVEVVLFSYAEWDIASTTTVFAESQFTHNSTFNITHSGSVRVGVEIEYENTFTIHHRAVIRGKDRVQNLPVWSFEPNWKDDYLETLEWLTDVLRSPTGAEQRRALRATPRRSFEFSIALQGNERAYFDNLLNAHGAHEWYFPLWQDIHYLEEATELDSNFLACGTAAGSFAVGDIVFIGQPGSSRKYELGEVFELSPEGISLIEPVEFQWEPNTCIFPVRVARFTEQPRPRRANDNTITSQIRFRVTERNKGVTPAIGGDTYRSFKVLVAEPDEAEAIDLGYERIMEELDNQVGIPSVYDSAVRAFPMQRHSWTLKGREDHSNFMSLIYGLRGKAIPVWLPTFSQDFELTANVAAGTSALNVRDVGFTAAGGPRDGRNDIMIELMDGTRIYRHIVASTTDGEIETLGLSEDFTTGFNVEDVFRISFLALSRLDQDAIEISHKADIEGVSTVVASFRNTPDLRQVKAGF